MAPVRELLLMFVRTHGDELWLEETIDLACTDDSSIGEARADVYARASEYQGQVAELRIRVPLTLVFAEVPTVDAEVSTTLSSHSDRDVDGPEQMA